MKLDEENQKLIESYSRFILARNYKGGKLLYITPVKDFLLWTQQKGLKGIQEVENDHIFEYYQFLSSRVNERRGGMLSDSTINGYLFSIGLLNEYLLEQKIINHLLIIPRKTDSTKVERNILTIEEIKILYDTCESEVEKALLSLAYGCGLRRNEIFHLNLSDVKFSKGILIVKSGKNNVRREIPMSHSVINHLKTYVLNERSENLLHAENREEALLVNKCGNRMSSQYSYRMLKRLVQRTGKREIIDKNITLHCLRHSIATHLSENGASMEFVREFLGHSELDTSQIYSKRRKRNQIFKV